MTLFIIANAVDTVSVVAANKNHLWPDGSQQDTRKKTAAIAAVSKPNMPVSYWSITLMADYTTLNCPI
jgi:hypothetical protein